MKRKNSKPTHAERYPGSVTVLLEPADNSFVESLAEAMCSTKRQVLLFAVSQLRLSPKASVLLSAKSDTEPPPPSAPVAQSQPEGLAA
jgi:hypothetical protein